MLPFSDVRVLEVASWTFVPAAGATLADLGADVIKVEPPAGDPQRGLLNLLAFLGGSGANPFVEVPNRGKRSVTLDLNFDEGRQLLLELVATSDVFLTSYLPARSREARARARGHSGGQSEDHLCGRVGMGCPGADGRRAAATTRRRDGLRRRWHSR